MSMYLIGDVQGCDEPLQRLLDTLAFSPSRDTLYMLGDLVNRGPQSLQVLRRLMGYGDAARCLLGNHDLHLLAIDIGAQPARRWETIHDILNAGDRADLVHWLKHQQLAILEHVGDTDLLMVHAGVLPAWDATKTIALASEIQDTLQSSACADFLQHLYGNLPDQWNESLKGVDRLRVIVNALTRLRFCSTRGQMEFETSSGIDKAPAGYLPWFDVPGRKTQDAVVAFGHWSTLGWQNRPDILALDTGCVWGGCLSAARINVQAGSLHSELIQVKCPQAQKPGADVTLT